jgi:DNA polymerase III delta prime subunit
VAGIVEPRGAETLARGSALGAIVVGDRVLTFYEDIGAILLPRGGPRPGIRRSPPSPGPSRASPEILGREEEVAAAQAAVESMVPLQFQGEPGSGKSTLLSHLVEHCTAPPDGIVQVSARGTEVSDLLQRVFEVMYETEAPLKLTDAQMQQFMQRLEALIVLDDVDLPPEDIQILMESAPHCSIALASAEELLWGEGRTIPVSDLPEPAALLLIERELTRTLRLEERPDATALWEGFNGHPLHLIQAIALIREEGRSFPHVAEMARASVPVEALVNGIVEVLTERERRMLGVLACLNGTPVHPDFVASLTGLSAPTPALNLLVRRGLAHSEGTRYSVAEPATETLRRAVEADWWSERIVDYLADWSEANRKDHHRILDESGPILWAIDQLEATARWPQLLRLARATEAAFGLGLMWSAWHKVLMAGLEAARELEDHEAEAWFLHQLGSRAMCTDDESAADGYLMSALELRQALPNDRQITATRNNLSMLEAEQSATPAVAPRAAAARTTYRDRRGRSAVALIAKLTAIVLLVAIPLGIFLVRHTPAGGLVLDQTSIKFGEQLVNSSPQTKQVTVTNEGPEAVSINGMALRPPVPDFAFRDNTCIGKPLRPGDTCRISVDFKPDSVGPVKADAVISETASGKRHVFAVSGIGKAGPGPAVRLDQESLDFGPVIVGRESKATVVLSNPGSLPLIVTHLAIAPQLQDFIVASDCVGAGKEVRPGQSCQLTVSFTPTAVGLRSAKLLISDNATGGPNQTIPLKGTGTKPANGPAVSLDPASLGFGVVTVGHVSPPQVLTVQNAGSTDLLFSGITVSGVGRADFRLTPSCAAAGSLRPGKTCTITVAFAPSFAGTRSAAISINDNAPGHPQVVPLSGTGLPLPQTPGVNLTPQALDFGSLPLGQTSSKSVKLTNSGQGALEITSIAISPRVAEFSVSESCPKSLGSKKTCTITLSFTPSQAQTSSASLVIIDSAIPNKQQVPLSGSGQDNGVPDATLDPTSLDFGNVPIGSLGHSSVTLTSSGTAPVTILSIGPPNPPFSIDSASSTCAVNSPLAPGLSCQIFLDFQPTTEVSFSDALTVIDDAPGSQQTVPLTGAGAPPPSPNATLSLSKLDFGSVPVGSSSSQALTVNNTGLPGSSLTIGSGGVSIVSAGSDDFTVDPASNCPGAILQSGESCQIWIIYAPTAAGSNTGANLVVTDNAPPGQQTVPLSGTGI